MFIKNLDSIGFKKFGKNVLISDKVSIYNPQNIELGDNVRIDDFCVISAGKSIVIGNNVHIACYSSLIGQGEIIMDDFSGLSSRVSVYSSSDDYSGEFLTNPTVDSEFTGVISKPVYLGKHVIVGAGSVILPGVSLQNGVAVGSLSLVTKSFEEYKIIGGLPAKFIKERKRKIEELEWSYLKK
jgi:acetyltransferase-like isoleucine patch superfamily enzyme